MDISNGQGKTVLVAMSGGVDSSVAALLLQRAGWQVIGVTMDTGYGDAPEQAKAVCEQLHISFHIVDVRQQFEQNVVQPFIEAYLRGETPNPCVNCNQILKFSAFDFLFEHEGAEYFATGHYIDLVLREGRYLLRCGDAQKDQSYFLYRLSQQVLARCIFPLCQMGKEQVRSIAAEAGLLSAGQKDSFDICFIPNGDYRILLRNRAGDLLRPGDIVDSQTNKICGHHNGLANYTIGQRRGINVALGYPAYVVALDHANNRLVLGTGEKLLQSAARTRDNNFLLFDRLNEKIACQVSIRYKAKPQPAVLTPAADGSDMVDIIFEKPVSGITPGQSAVFYQDDLLIGGGIFV